MVEDVASCINELLDAQDDGEIEQGFLFVWDSVGSIGCYKEYNSGAGKIGNPMWTAAAISAAFNNIVNDRIPSSRKVTTAVKSGYQKIPSLFFTEYRMSIMTMTPLSSRRDKSTAFH